jgi:GNAT superfamily N-acetyltransferase
VVDSGEQVVGFALFFTNFSTFLAKPGLYLEDLFVEPELRGRGIGQACSPAWPSSPPSAAAAGSNGACSTGT